MNIIIASHLGKFDELKQLVETEKQDVNQTDPFGDTALHAAAAKGRLEIVKYLVDKGANVNAKNKAGSTPLHKITLAKYDQFEIIRFLTKKGANANEKNEAGLYPDDLAKTPALIELLQGTNLFTAKVPLAKDLHGRIIGKKGAKLKELRAETKTTIVIPAPDDKSNEIIIKGRPDNVELAKRKILALTSNKSVYKNEESAVVAPKDQLTTSTRLKVPKDKYKNIIGKGGKKIKEIIGNSSVQIVIPSEDEDEDVLISGPIEEVNTVIRKLTDVIHDDPKKKITFNLFAQPKQDQQQRPRKANTPVPISIVMNDSRQGRRSSPRPPRTDAEGKDNTQQNAKPEAKAEVKKESKEEEK